MALPAERESSQPSPFASTGASGWEETRVQTQMARVVGDRDGLSVPDIGRDVGNGQRELFVACDPADAMQQQFEHLKADYVAVHDVGTHASRKLLSSIASMMQRPVQQLAIRRPGGGTTLATIEFVDCRAGNGALVRLYGTAVDADTATRQALARVLLGNARLGILMVGDLPAHAMASALEPVRDAVRRGDGWSCRRLLAMPLAATAALPEEITKLRAATGLDVTPTSQVTRPAEVWTLLCGAWNALQLKAAAALPPGAALPLLGAGAQRVVGAAAASGKPGRPGLPALTPMPEVGKVRQAPRDAPLEHYLQTLSQLAGVVSACAFDLSTGRPLGHAGARPGPEELGRHGSALLAATQSAARILGLGAAVPEMTITLGQHHLLLRPLPAHPGMGLHVVLDKPHAVLPVLLVQLRRLDDELVTGTRAATR